ncbi:response regulator transcription factor [Pueribacillus sp. YX66]|uniref:response regulator transcription factor n=1 Tax=Pueribacillus sp. YX66 TaxID=3229242 RepID=UPI00358CF01A
MNKQYHVLVVDDEKEMVELVTSYLRKERFQVSSASNGYALLQKLEEQEVDLILLDLMMPYMDGFTACKEIRKFSDVPIIMLTAKGEEADRVSGLKMGADDYIVKPFSPNELLARIEALLRRTNQNVKSALLRIGKLVIDIDGRTVKVNDKPITLTRKEFDLLLLLAKNKERVFTREQLHDRVWGMEHSKATLRTVDTHIKTLRIKLGKASELIKTVWGVGYKLEE